MAQFKYEAKDKDGSIHKGTMTADTQSIVLRNLKKKRLRAVQVFEVPATLANKEINLADRKVKLKDLVFYLTQFATLINAGITIIQANSMMLEQTKSKVLREALESVVEDLDGGRSLSEAYSKFPKVFPVMLVNVVKAAEVSGTLEITLKRMALYYEKQNRNKSKLISSMIYPIILFVMAIGVSIFLMVYVVPMFVDLFESMEGELPPITIMTQKVSDFIRTKGWVIVVVIIIVVLMYNILLRNPKFRFQNDMFKLRVPAFGVLLQKNDISVIMSTLSNLLESSVAVVTALNMTQDTVSNVYMKKVIELCRQEVEKGGSISTVFKESWAFPSLVTQMVEVGETTGSLEQMLQKLSIIYEEEVDTAAERLKSIMEPLIIVFIAVIVGFIIAAIMLPMFSLYEQMQG